MTGSSDGAPPALLVLDLSYTYEMIKERGLEDTVLCRDLDGFFRHVWSVHPFASLLTSEAWTSRTGKPVTHEVSDRHTFIEGKIGRFKWLSWLFPLNFLIAQAALFFRLRRLIKREGIRVIRAGDPLYVGLFGLLLARTSGVPMLIRNNGNNAKVRRNTGAPLYPKLFRSEKMEERIERFVLPRADMVAALNPDNLEFVLESGARPERTTLFRVGNLIAREHLKAPAERIVDEGYFASLGLVPRRYILTVGRLQPLKHPDDVVRAFAQVRAAGCDAALAFAGEGTLQPELEQLAESLGVREHVHFVGNQTQVALAQLNTFAAVVISPMTGRALSESALCGAPVVAYDADWQREIVETGVTGELFPFGDVDGMARGTIKMLRDPAYARAMGDALRERAMELLDPDRLNEHERSVYTQLMQERARQGRLKL